MELLAGRDAAVLMLLVALLVLAMLVLRLTRR
jgi:hypothetical protein